MVCFNVALAPWGSAWINVDQVVQMGPNNDDPNTETWLSLADGTSEIVDHPFDEALRMVDPAADPPPWIKRNRAR